MTTAPTPEAFIADIESRAARHETPCGEGAMAWREWGAGPPILLLHGAHGAWTHWIRNVEPLSRGYRVLAPDMPGYGDSAMPARPDDAENFAEIIAAGLRQLGIAQIDIVGFSTGAVVGAHMAALSPDLVRRLVIVDAGGLDTPMHHTPLTPLRGLEGEALDAAHRANLLAIMLHSPASIDDLALHLQRTAPRRARAKAHTFVLPDKLNLVLPRVAAPVDVIWGALDGPHPDPALQLEVIQRFKPHATLRVVADAGHWVMFEAAAGFNEALLDLLAQPPRG